MTDDETEVVVHTDGRTTDLEGRAVDATTGALIGGGAPPAHVTVIDAATVQRPEVSRVVEMPPLTFARNVASVPGATSSPGALPGELRSGQTVVSSPGVAAAPAGEIGGEHAPQLARWEAMISRVRELVAMRRSADVQHEGKQRAERLDAEIHEAVAAWGLPPGDPVLMRVAALRGLLKRAQAGRL